MASGLNTVVLSVASREEVTERILAAFDGQEQGNHISFATPELLWQTLTAKRWAILKIMTGKGAMAIREVARLVGRDVKAVHKDVHILLDAGILDRAEDGRIIFPFDAIHVDFMVKAA